MKKTTFALALVLTFSLSRSVFDSALEAIASDNLDSQAKDAGTDTKTGTKKAVRKVKRGARKVTGQDNVIKDAGDHVKDFGDDVKGSAEKAKHH